MKFANSVSTVTRLIAMKREELDSYRQDLSRLEQIVRLAHDKFSNAINAEKDFLSETRLAESDPRGLRPAAMMDRRHYLAYLEKCCKSARGALDESVMQHDLAQHQLEKIFAEIRTLERLAERRLSKAAEEEQRLGYLRADDQEVTKNANMKAAYASY